MNQVLINKQKEFIALKYDHVHTSMKQILALRDKFVKEYSIKKLPNLKIENFVVGKGDTFCKELENELGPLGTIQGGPAFKFGIYYGKEKPDTNLMYRYYSKWGDNEKVAFHNIKGAMLSLLDDGKKENIIGIVSNPLSNVFKGKLLATYFPDRYLSVFSNPHLDHFLTAFNLDSKDLIKINAVYKREVLRELKNKDEYFKDWSMEMFVHFLYNEYPCKPSKNKEILMDGSLQLRDFIPGSVGQEIFLTIENNKMKSDKNDKLLKKVDYVKQQIIKNVIGSRGEKIVFDYEKAKLRKAGLENLVDHVTQVSESSDSYGYDILSFDPISGEKRYIEVKTTSGPPGDTTFFISDNEYRKAQLNENYHIYVVYDIYSFPKVWELGNPFNPHNENISISPANYKVSISAIMKDK